jgi:hypothetical protein
MIAVEVLVALMVISVVVFGIAKIAAPIAEAFADRLKLKFQELGPEEEHEMKTRICALEEEVRGLKQQIANVQETADFAVKTLQAHDTESGTKIHISDKKTIS